MTDRNSDGPTSKLAATRREREVQARVESLFRHCESSKNPVLAYSRACSKVGYLARDGVRSELHHLVSALNERKHALVMGRYGHPEKAQEHNRECARELLSFQRGVRSELNRPRVPPSTPELRERVERNLDVGQWSRARSDLDDLMRRPDIGRPLPALDTYSRSWNLHPEHFALLQDRIDQCNASVRGPEHRQASGATRTSQEHSHASESVPQPTNGVPHPPAGASRASGDAAIARSVQRPDPPPPSVDTHRHSAKTVRLEVGNDRGLDR